VIIVFVVLWTLANVFAERFGWTHWDPPPFIWLQGIIGLFDRGHGRLDQAGRPADSLSSMRTSICRLTLTEQKATKIIQLRRVAP
jgi:hypothetical protein